MVYMKSISLSLLLCIEQKVDGFLLRNEKPFGIRELYSSSSTPPIATNNNEETGILASDNNDENNNNIVEAPLKYQGPYPCLGLRFPNLATASQRERNVTGISLDFVVDTAANVNTLNLQVAQELGLDVVGQAPAGVGAAGAIRGADTYMLGDCELEKAVVIGSGGEEEGNKQEATTPFIFMSDLTASALPIAAPTSAGILGLAFLQCFPGGVEFTWGQNSVLAGDKDESAKRLYPTMRFHADETTINVEVSKKAIITPMPVTLLPSITIRINGVEMPALLDTGSPITVLNQQAAKAARIDTVFKIPEPKQSINPFSSLSENFKLAQAASRGEVLGLAGVDGQPVYLLKTKDDDNDIEVAIVAGDGSDIDFNSKGSMNSPLYVGDLPGLAALNGLGVDSPPAVVLGVDVLRRRSRMLYRGQQNELYF